MSTQNEYRGRSGTKFQLVVLTLLLGTLALIMGKMDGNAWGMYVVGLVTAYVVGDAAARFAAKTP
jgi:hypothetical protein